MLAHWFPRQVRRLGTARKQHLRAPHVPVLSPACINSKKSMEQHCARCASNGLVLRSSAGPYNIQDEGHLQYDPLGAGVSATGKYITIEAGGESATGSNGMLL